MRKLLSTKYSAGAFNTAMLLTRLAFGGIMMYHGYEKLIGFSTIKNSFIVFRLRKKLKGISICHYKNRKFYTF